MSRCRTTYRKFEKNLKFQRMHHILFGCKAKKSAEFRCNEPLQDNVSRKFEKFLKIQRMHHTPFGCKAFRFDNKSTLSKVQMNDNECTCSMPLILKRGWNHLNFDVQNLCESAFGVRGKTMKTLSFRPRCRIFRVFLQEKPYSHTALPRVLMLTSVV